MTTLNPSHIPTSSDSALRGQAVYKRDAADSPTEEYDESGYPKSVKKLERDARREARQRIKRVQPPIPDLRSVLCTKEALALLLLTYTQFDFFTGLSR